jgi:hypothetical protein
MPKICYCKVAMFVLLFGGCGPATERNSGGGKVGTDLQDLGANFQLEDRVRNKLGFVRPKGPFTDGTILISNIDVVCNEVDGVVDVCFEIQNVSPKSICDVKLSIIAAIDEVGAALPISIDTGDGVESLVPSERVRSIVSVSGGSKRCLLTLRARHRDSRRPLYFDLDFPTPLTKDGKALPRTGI